MPIRSLERGGKMPNNTRDINFGMGQDGGSGGNNSWSAPIYGCDSEGNDVTVSFGQNNHQGETLISSGHKSFDDFYNKNSGHDHYGPNGETGRNGDRGAYK